MVGNIRLIIPRIKKITKNYIVVSQDIPFFILKRFILINGEEEEISSLLWEDFWALSIIFNKLKKPTKDLRNIEKIWVPKNYIDEKKVFKMYSIKVKWHHKNIKIDYEEKDLYLAWTYITELISEISGKLIINNEIIDQNEFIIFEKMTKFSNCEIQTPDQIDYVLFLSLKGKTIE